MNTKDEGNMTDNEKKKKTDSYVRINRKDSKTVSYLYSICSRFRQRHGRYKKDLNQTSKGEKYVCNENYLELD